MPHTESWWQLRRIDVMWCDVRIASFTDSDPQQFEDQRMSYKLCKTNVVDSD